jgi:hypothetical protein
VALFASEVTNFMLNNVIESEDFNNFHESVRKELDIGDINYEIVLRNSFYEQGGYTNIENRARVVFEENWAGIKEVTLSAEGLKHLINTNFYKLTGDAFERVVFLCIQYAVVHELVHVQQYKLKKLTQSKKRALEQVPYEKRDVEIEANSIAKEITSRNCQFDQKIITILTSNESINNETLPGVLRLFEKMEKE